MAQMILKIQEADNISFPRRLASFNFRGCKTAKYLKSREKDILFFLLFDILQF